MPIYYINNNGKPQFYDPNIGNIPDGAKQLDESIWLKLMQDQSSGMTIKCCDEGPYSENVQSPEISLEEYKKSCINIIKIMTQKFIEQKPDGSTRYDNVLMNAIILFLLENGATAEPAASAISWINSVKMEMLTLATLVRSCQSVSEVDDIDTSYTYFETLFGVNGSRNPDPDITMFALLQAQQT